MAVPGEAQCMSGSETSFRGLTFERPSPDVGPLVRSGRADQRPFALWQDRLLRALALSAQLLPLGLILWG